jgi:hypothetical protein
VTRATAILSFGMWWVTIFVTGEIDRLTKAKHDGVDAAMPAVTRVHGRLITPSSEANY